MTLLLRPMRTASRPSYPGLASRRARCAAALAGVAVLAAASSAARAEQGPEAAAATTATPAGAADPEREPIRIGGVPIRPRRLLAEVGIATRLVGFDEGVGVYVGPEITTGFMIRYFEALIRFGVDIAASDPAGASNTPYLIRQDVLLGTVIDLDRVVLQVRVGVRYNFFQGVGALMGLAASYSPQRSLLISATVDGGLESMDLVWKNEAGTEGAAARELVWSLGFSVSIASWW